MVPPEHNKNEESHADGPGQLTSKRVSDHLANERTFLAWVRTGIATMTFGFVIARFGLFLRELGLKAKVAPLSPFPFSQITGVVLTLLGVCVLLVALLNFLRIRRAIDAEAFHPQKDFAIVLTVLSSVIGLLLAIYLLIT